MLSMCVILDAHMPPFYFFAMHLLHQRQPLLAFTSAHKQVQEQLQLEIIF